MLSLETPDTLTVCEPCQHCWVLMASVVLECSCSVPRLRILLCNDPFILLDYMVYQLKCNSVHGLFNGTIAMSEEDREEFFVVKRDRNQGIQLPSAWKPQITTTSSIHWCSLGTLSLVCSYPRTLATHTSSSSFQTATSSRSARWLRSLTCCEFGIRRMAHEPHTPKLHRHSGNIKGGRRLFSALSRGTLSVLFHLLFSLGLSFPPLVSPWTVQMMLRGHDTDFTHHVPNRAHRASRQHD